MEKEDFVYEADQFANELGRLRFAVRHATAKFDRMIEDWIDLGVNFLNNATSFQVVPDQSRIDGDVLGKKFSIHYALLSKDANGVLEVAICAQYLGTETTFTISQFLIKSDGSILDRSGEELIGRNDSDWSYRMLVAVLRKVLSASTTEIQ